MDKRRKLMLFATALSALLLGLSFLSAGHACIWFPPGGGVSP